MRRKVRVSLVLQFHRQLPLVSKTICYALDTFFQECNAAQVYWCTLEDCNLDGEATP